MKKRLAPYQHWDLNELKDTLELHVNRLSCGSHTKRLWIKLIDDAFRSERWDVLKQYNGCTMLQDHLHPDPACFIHDFMWITGHGGAVSDRIFYNCMISEGMNGGKSWRRWLGVRIGWLCYFQWKYMKNRTLVPISKNMIEFDNHFKK